CAALFVASCSSPAPVAPTPSLSTPPTQAPPTDIASPTAMASPTAPAVATVAPASPEALSADQASTFSEARLLQVEGDYAGAAEKWRSLLDVTPDARVSLVACLAAAGDGVGALNVLSSGGPDPRDGFVRGLALEASGQHAAAMQSMADYANANLT